MKYQWRYRNETLHKECLPGMPFHYGWLFTDKIGQPVRYVIEIQNKRFSVVIQIVNWKKKIGRRTIALKPSVVDQARRKRSALLSYERTHFALRNAWVPYEWNCYCCDLKYSDNKATLAAYDGAFALMKGFLLL